MKAKKILSYMKNHNPYDEKSNGIALPVGIIALLFSLIFIATSIDNIITRAGWDPDDQLRMVQIRDFLGGQSWFDWTQYRMNVPEGAPMHWSRFIELPIAFLIIIFTPIFGQNIAEMIAGTAVPLFGLTLTSYFIGRVALHIWNRQAAIFAILLIWINPAITFQFKPMRIDHHGWQIMLASLALWTMFWPNKKRGGLAMGGALAVWLHISLEGLPITAAFFIILGWRWIIEKAHGQRLIWAITSFTMMTLALYVATQGLPFGATIYCDSISPPYLLAISAAAIIMLIAINRTPQHRLIRLFLAGLAGTVALGLLILTAPQCAGGAFAQMDRLVYEYWYVNVSEGLPIWHQKIEVILLIITIPMIGIMALLIFTSKIPKSARSNLYLIGYFAIYAALISCLVFRTVTVSAAFAIPLVAILLAQIFRAYSLSSHSVKRIILVITMLVVATAGPILSGLAAAMLPSVQKIEAVHHSNMKCKSVAAIQSLQSLPTPSHIMAPFNLSTLILLSSDHYVLGSSHHRNEKAMHDQIAMMIGTPSDALEMLKQRKIEYIVTCPDSPEWSGYKLKHKDSLAARVLDGDVPHWLVRVPNDGDLLIWRVAPDR